LNPSVHVRESILDANSLLINGRPSRALRDAAAGQDHREIMS
jgi:hypothetical protein